MIHKTRKHHFNRHDNMGFKNLVSFFVANLAICNDINDVQSGAKSIGDFGGHI